MTRTSRIVAIALVLFGQQAFAQGNATQAGNNASFQSAHHGFVRGGAGWVNTISSDGSGPYFKDDSKYITVQGGGMNYQVAGGYLMTMAAQGFFFNRPSGYIVTNSVSPNAGTATTTNSNNNSSNSKAWLAKAGRGIFKSVKEFGGNYLVAGKKRELVTIDAKGFYHVLAGVSVPKDSRIGGNFWISPEGQLTRVDFKGAYCTDFNNKVTDVTDVGGNYFWKGDQMITVPSTDCFAREANGEFVAVMKGSSSITIENDIVRGGTYVVDVAGTLFGVALDGSIKPNFNVSLNYPQLIGYSFLSYSHGDSNESSRLFAVTPDGTAKVVTDQCGVCPVAIQPQYNFSRKVK